MTTNEPTIESEDAPRPRPRGRPRVAANRTAILEATRALLAEHPLEDIRITQILGAAGVARGTFYSFFDSKHAVAAALLEEIMGEIGQATQAYVARAADVPPAEGLIATVETGVELWARHRVVLGAAVENWRTIPELAEKWLDITNDLAAAVAAEIDRQRAAGLAPDGHDSRELSAGLVHSTLHCLYLSGLGKVDGLPSEHGIADMVLALWFATVYRTPPPRRAAPKP